MKIVIGVDPGPTLSGLAVLDGSLRLIKSIDQASTDEIAAVTEIRGGDIVMVIEGLSPRGGGNMAQIFARWGLTIATAKTIGYLRRLCDERGWRFVELGPSTWRTQFCGGPGAGDAQIKACVRAVYESRGLAVGGGVQAAEGIKRQPGPLYGLRGHAWDGIGVALTWMIDENLI